MAASVDLTIEQGSDWALTFPVLDSEDEPVDVSAWSARAQVRARAEDATILHDWTSTSPTGGIKLGLQGITLSVTAAQSSAWTWRRGVWDLELVDPDGVVTRIAKGRVHVDPEVTR